ncbi:hypothetical protein NJC40_25685 [Pseudomonas sp. 21LCFQ02]|uniref:hypothetical protein n=1 Tax=Pseudomonas sp. 21LCFQ02 TaxID=2957505 RepID=UPI00209AFA5A|nr:hypothetical protein [Pseudomonas sp. 21LCFQ02]MCO8171166.1 hypothetical protein [Pseudomonas sp. 21LCFQ02]
MIDHSEQFIEVDETLTPTSRQAAKADLDLAIARFLANGGTVTVVGQLEPNTSSTSGPRESRIALPQQARVKKKSDLLLKTDLEIKARIGKNLHEAAAELGESLSRCQQLARTYRIPFRTFGASRNRKARA